MKIEKLKNEIIIFGKKKKIKKIEKKKISIP